jgi:hypothetical protein
LTWVRKETWQRLGIGDFSCRLRVVKPILNLIVVTVLGAVIAGIYNLAVKVTGGLLVGFTSN